MYIKGNECQQQSFKLVASREEDVLEVHSYCIAAVRMYIQHTTLPPYALSFLLPSHGVPTKTVQNGG
jgi:hypothetical protein